MNDKKFSNESTSNQKKRSIKDLQTDANYLLANIIAYQINIAQKETSDTQYGFADIGYSIATALVNVSTRDDFEQAQVEMATALQVLSIIFSTYTEHYDEIHSNKK